LGRPGTGRLGELDSLRGLAAVTVMVYHYCAYLSGRNPDFPVPDVGIIAVAGFFIISGFVILMATEKHTLKGFVGSRLIRIYPAYWLCLALTVVLVPLLGVAARPSGREVAFNATMVQSFFFVRSIDDVYWTLQVEVSFYAVIAVLMALGWLKRTEWLAAVGLGLFLALNLLVGRWNPDWTATQKLLLMPLFVSGFYAHAPLLLGGMLFYRVRQSGFTWVRVILLLVCLGSLPYTYRELDVIGIALIFGLFVWLSLAPIPPLNHPTLRFLGYISYPLYLIHHQVGQAILGNLAGILPGFWAMLATMAIVLAMAAAIHLGFEKPVTRWLRRRFFPTNSPSGSGALPVGGVAPAAPGGSRISGPPGPDLHF
jgi:peptidoglycan/LPS O-acetylase OafA/YrhL